MRYFSILAFLFCLFLPPSLSAQKPDSIKLIISPSQDSVHQLVREEFDRHRDSLEALRIRQNVQKNGKSLDAFLQEMKDRENARKRQLYFRIGFVTVFLAVPIVVFARRRKLKG